LTPQLTVFTTFYEPHAQYLDEAIASVLTQSFADFEYLIVNDGPFDDARRIEQKFRDSRVRLITNPARLGLIASRNAGLREGRGDLIALLDADDFCEPDRLQKQMAFMRAHPDHVLLGSALRYVDEKSQTIGSRSYPGSDDDIKRKLLVMNCIAQSTVVARRQSLIDAGGYTNEFRDVEDYDLWLRLARFGKFHNLQEPLVAYRIHPEASKRRMVRHVLRASTRLKIHAIRHYGFKATPRAVASIAAHVALSALPDRAVYWLFRRLFVR
jgi:glycosyltransferase involved in cell wall biosynthesis